jgi:hypothetical protein
MKDAVRLQKSAGRLNGVEQCHECGALLATVEILSPREFRRSLAGSRFDSEPLLRTSEDGFKSVLDDVAANCTPSHHPVNR